MIKRSIKVKIVKTNPKKITFKLVSVNRLMHVAREVFDERVESGDYTVLNEYKIEK